MITVLTLLKTKPSPNGAQHGERPFWREWGATYLEAWLAGVAEHVPNPKRIVVMTDSDLSPQVPSELREDNVPVHCVTLDAIDAPGWWAKLNMFRVGVGKCLYLDLDNVLCGSIAELCALDPDPIIMMDDRHVPRLPNGSAILFDAWRVRGIWHAYQCDPRKVESVFAGPVCGDYSNAYDQAFIAHYVRVTQARPVPLFQDLLPRGYCINAFSELPESEDWHEARLIFGCGSAKMHTMDHPAIAEHWNR